MSEQVGDRRSPQRGEIHLPGDTALPEEHLLHTGDLSPELLEESGHGLRRRVRRPGNPEQLLLVPARALRLEFLEPRGDGEIRPRQVFLRPRRAVDAERERRRDQLTRLRIGFVGRVAGKQLFRRPDRLGPALHHDPLGALRTARDQEEGGEEAAQHDEHEGQGPDFHPAFHASGYESETCIV